MNIHAQSAGGALTANDYLSPDIEFKKKVSTYQNGTLLNNSSTIRTKVDKKCGNKIIYQPR
jgi:hypothetical protein